MSFRNKLITLFILFTAIPLSLVSLISYNFLKENIISSIEVDRYNIAKAAEANVNFFLEERLLKLKNLAQFLELKKIDWDNKEELDSTLKLLKDYYDNFDYFYFVNLKGEVVATAPETDFSGDSDFSNRDWFNHVINTGKPYISNKSLLSDANNKPIIFISIPVMDNNNQLLGLLCGNISLERLTSTVSYLDFAQTGKVIVTDNQDYVIAHSDFRKVIMRESFNLDEAISFSANIYQVTYNSQDHLLIRKSINNAFNIYVIQEKNEALSSLQKLTQELVLITVITFLLAIGATVITSQRFVRPINLLTKGAKEINLGKFGYQIKYKGKDEISTFINSFNEMSRRLKGFVDELRPIAEASLKFNEFKKDFLDVFLSKNSINNDNSVILKEGLERILEKLNLTNGTIFWNGKQKIFSNICLGIDENLFRELVEYCEGQSTDYEGEIIFCKYQLNHPLVETTSNKIKDSDFIIINKIKVSEFYGYFVTIVSIPRNILAEEIKLINTTTKILSMVLENEYQKEQLLLREKFSAIGQIAAGLAHEIKNPMTSIKGFMQLMLLDKDKLLNKDHLDLMLKELDRINTLINDFLGLAKPTTPKIGNCIAWHVIEEIIALKKHDFDTRGINLILQEKTLKAVAADHQLLKQVLINVIYNAYEAMPEGGNLKISCYQEKKSLSIEVKDEGYGINKEALPKIFDPFFTTKDYGTGLGLSIAYQIIKQMNGSISVFNNTPKRGATFKISLPLFEEKI